jgi:hypothetical protein
MEAMGAWRPDQEFKTVEMSLSMAEMALITAVSL